jgi:hypothetical protein
VESLQKMAEFSPCTGKLHPYAVHVAKYRDTLKALIRLEQRYYQRTNYLSPQGNEYEDENDDDKDVGCGGDYVKSFSIVVDVSRGRSSASVDMIAEMASLVTDLRLASPAVDSIDQSEQNYGQPHDRSSQQQDAWIRTPESDPKSHQRKIQNFNSPTSSTDSIYRDVPSDDCSHLPSKSCNNKTVRRRRPTALEVSCLRNWRHQMLDWTCNLCHSVFPYNKGTVVAVTFNILDRYLAIVLGSERNEEQYLYSTVQYVLPLSKQDFQLFCMVSLYIAAKLWIPANRNHLTVTTMVAISQGLYSEDNFCAVERDILLAVDWHINPPTVMDFCDIYIDLLWIGPPDPAVSVAIRHKCEYFAETALDDVYFLDKPNAIVALAIILLLIDDFRGLESRYKSLWRRYGSVNDDILTAFLRNIQGVVHIQNAEFESILRRLEYFA